MFVQCCVCIEHTYVCVCVCVCVSNTNTTHTVHTYVCTIMLLTCTSLHTAHWCTYTRMYTCTYVYVHTYTLGEEVVELEHLEGQLRTLMDKFKYQRRELKQTKDDTKV